MARKARRSQARQIKEMLALQALTDIALTHLNLDILLPELLGRIHDIIGVDNIAILLLEPDGTELRIRAVRGIEEAVAPSVRVPMGQGFAGRIAASATALVVDDVTTYPVSNLFLQQHLCSVAGVPLIVNRQVVGVLHIGTAKPTKFSQDDVTLLQRVADRIALAIERSALYEAEKAKAQEFEAMFNAMTDGVIVVDNHGTIIRVNDALHRIYGTTGSPHTLEKPLGQRVGTFHPHTLDGQALAPADAPSQRVVRGETLMGMKAVDLSLTRLDGRGIVLNFSGAPLYDASEHIRGGILVVRDITDQHNLEQMREDFINIASHELRTPLTSIVLTAKMIERRLDKLDQPQTTRELMQMLLDSSKRLNRLIDDMLDMTKITTGLFRISRESCDLAEVVGHIVDEMRQTWKREVMVTGVEQSIQAYLDKERLWQALANLLANAFKYSPPTTAIGVDVNIKASRQGQIARICVWDRGAGIPVEMHSHIFERYRRSGEDTMSQNGLGLGLFIVKQIIEKHEGTIWVEATEGGGASFVIEMPLESHQSQIQQACS